MPLSLRATTHNAMPRTAFTHVRTWVFDLDNTLYPPAMRLFDQIEARMVTYLVRELGVSADDANSLRRQYWADYGTTLAGLMHVHGVDPDPFLEEVHDIDFDVLAPDPSLAAAISGLPGRKIIYTNGCAPYARNVIAACGLDGLFDAIYGVEHASYVPKPNTHAFTQVFTKDGLAPEEAAMFEDEARNLQAPHALGMRTVLVGPEQTAPHIHHQTEDLTGFLQTITG